ncbi:hypothetical protein FHU14_000932 [Mesorhizobium sp. RMAD-H1]|nr:hypothetical protein [Mesorhizobium sp. RMAD-H1]
MSFASLVFNVEGGVQPSLTANLPLEGEMPGRVEGG